MKFSLQQKEYTFQGILSVLPGDNLASNYLGGYKSLSSALWKCRHCMAVEDDMQSNICNYNCLFLDI